MAITTRETTADGVTNKGAPLTNAEVDQNFIDLQQQKVDISALATTVRYFPTDTASGISTYTLMVDSLDDAEYDSTAVDIDTGAINGSDVFIAGVVSEAETLSGNPGNINVQTIGNIRRTSGNAEAEFYFEVYHRTSGGTETLMGTSSNTSPVSSAIYVEFFADCLLDNPVEFTATDRVVIKYYGTKVGNGSSPSFDFQFGGTAPIRTNFPVPINVAVQDQDASQVQTDTGAFNGKLSGSDTTVQAALDTLDDHVHTIAEVTNLQDSLDDKLAAADNLSDLDNASTALTNLGLTATAEELNTLDGITADVGELNKLDGVTATTGEINYLDITTLGTSEASKVVTADANGVVTFDNGTIEEVTALSGTSVTIDLQDGDNFTHSLSGNTTYTFSNPASSGKASAFTLKLYRTPQIARSHGLHRLIGRRQRLLRFQVRVVRWITLCSSPRTVALHFMASQQVRTCHEYRTTDADGCGWGACWRWGCLDRPRPS